MEIKDLLRIKGTTKDGRIFDDQDKDHCPACGHPQSYFELRVENY